MSDRTRTAPESERMLPNGTVLADRYRIEALTGVGGMGMVYRAHDLELDIPVALKVMRPERVADRQMLERFRRELILARQVSHRNVVRIHDIGSDEGRLFLTMDYIEGRALDDILDKEGPLPVERSVTIAAQLARALAAAHAEGVIHRDLKPANILVTEDDRAFITDFGIARSLADSGLTEVGSVLGTPDYLSPEQARGNEVDGRSDIYSLGLILYRLLTDTLPFSGDTYEEIIAQHSTGHIRDISRTGVEVPSWLRRVIGRCLERNPADRYQDAGELADDLERKAGPRYVKHGRSIAAVAAVAVLTTMAALLLPWEGQQESESSSEGADSETVVDAEPASSVAILPLRHDGEEEGWLRHGFSELLAAQLMESPQLKVVASARLQRTLQDLDIDPHRLSPRDAQRLMEMLDVDRLVTGIVAGDESSYRIQLEVLAAGGLGAQEQRISTDMIAGRSWTAAMDELTQSLRTALEVGGKPLSTGHMTDSLEALETYSTGLEALQTGDSLSAVPQLEAAVERDPGFVAAWVALSNAHAALGRDADARDAADRAVEVLGPDPGRWAYEARAQQARLSGNPEEAERYMKELVSAYPHDVEASVKLAETIGEAGRFDAAIAQLEKVVQQDVNHPRAYYLLGKYSILKGNSQQAADEYLVRALVIQNKLGNRQGKADVLNALGIAWHQLGDLEQAMDYYRESAELREQVGDRRGVAAALSNIARIQLLQGDYDGARSQLRTALAELESIGDRAGTANLHNELGILEEEVGDYSAALSRYRQALQLRQGAGDRRAVAESRNNVGYAYYLLGQYDNAAVYLQQSLDVYQETSNPDGLMQVNQALGLLDIARGNWNEAIKAFLEALELARDIEFPHAMAISHGNLGQVASLQGRYAAAAESFRQATEIMESVGDPRGLAEFSLARAEMALGLGMLSGAQQQLDISERALGVADNTEQSAWHAALSALSAGMKGDVDPAIQRINAALEEADASGSEFTRLRVAAIHLELMLVLDDARQALELAGDYRARSDALGNVPLRLAIREVESEAAMRLGDRERARVRASEALRLVADAGDYRSTWTLHRVASWAATDVAESERQARAANREYERVRGNMTDAQRAAFARQYPPGNLINEDSNGYPATGT